ncbi:MAG: HPF/RaiA family ribosome-associated protein [Candidatus Niyogibacteria bacterium]|nr:HPF/RaiA family ribosome-associated protein [Candidatus Niyogibacteria bacterium]
MRTHLKTTRFEHTDASDALAEEKLIRPVQKLLAELDQRADLLLDIEFERTTRHHEHGKIWRAEAQLSLPSRSQELRAEAVGETLREAVDIVKTTLLDEIKMYKEKLRKG